MDWQPPNLIASAPHSTRFLQVVMLSLCPSKTHLPFLIKTIDNSFKWIHKTLWLTHCIKAPSNREIGSKKLEVMWKLSKRAERENKEFCIVWIHKNSGRVSLLYETLILFVLLVCSWILFTSEEGHIGVLEISKRSPVLWTLYGLCITKDRHKYLSQYSVSMKGGCQWCPPEKKNNGMHTTIGRHQGNGLAKELSYFT